MNHDPVKQAWQASVEIARTPPLDEVRKGADKLYRRVRRRNSIEYAACAIVIVLAGPMMLKGPHILHKIGAAMLVVAVLYVAWQLHRRASAVPPDAAGTMPIYEFLRGQLARQRDALRGVLWWYLLPLVPGMVLIFAGNGLDPVIEAAGPPIWLRWVAIAVIMAIFGFAWWINQVAARRLQKRIDEIDALTGRTE